VHQAGSWSLYADLGLAGLSVGLALVLVSSYAFSRCVPNHSTRWFRVYTDAEIQRHNTEAQKYNQTHTATEDNPHRSMWRKGDGTGEREGFSCLVGAYTVIVVLAAGFSVGSCPAATDLMGPHWVVYQPSAPAPPCTNECVEPNGVCEDGGRGASSNRCDLGSDTASCGCRNGTTLDDWGCKRLDSCRLAPAELELARELDWSDRYDVLACGGAVRTALFSLLPLLALLTVACRELVRMRGRWVRDGFAPSARVP
jgi:hypothetical protein